MYVDDTGGADETVTTEHLTVTVEGQDYQVEENYDHDHDGRTDSAVIRDEDGTGVVYVDADSDGDADVYIELDESGRPVAEARFDPGSGEWVAVDPHAPAGPDTEAAAGGATDGRTDAEAAAGAMTVESPPDGEVITVPAPTIDTNDDGVADTSVVRHDDGSTYYFTDADNDGDADFMMITRPDGAVEAYEHRGGGMWTPTR